MAITYSWKVLSLNKTTTENLQNAIVRVDWSCTGTDENGLSGSFGSQTEFDQSEIDPNNFVPYEQLTEQIVLGWIDAKINADTVYKNYIEESIAIQIDYVKNTVFQNNFPWNQ